MKWILHWKWSRRTCNEGCVADLAKIKREGMIQPQIWNLSGTFSHNGIAVHFHVVTNNLDTWYIYYQHLLWFFKLPQPQFFISNRNLYFVLMAKWYLSSTIFSGCIFHTQINYLSLQAYCFPLISFQLLNSF